MSKLITLTQEQLDEFAHSVAAHVAAKVLAGLEAAGRLKRSRHDSDFKAR